MEIKPLISIIVPIYNTENYLEKCLNSVLNQTYQNLEIILINDGSTDGSEKIIKKYLDNLKIKYYKKENGGLANTRNFGIKKATGKYIAWVDSDDWIDKNTIEELVDTAQKEKSDFIISGVRLVNEKDEVINNYIPSQASLKEVLYKGYFPNKFVSRELYISNNISCQEGELYEDVGTVCYLFLKAKNPIITKNIYYNYLQREGSIVQTRDIKKLDLVKQYIRLHEYLIKNNLWEKYQNDYKWGVKYIKNMLIIYYSSFDINFLIKYYDEIIKTLKCVDEYRLGDHIKFFISFFKERIKKVIKKVFNTLGIDIKKLKSIIN